MYFYLQFFKIDPCLPKFLIIQPLYYPSSITSDNGDIRADVVIPYVCFCANGYLLMNLTLSGTTC